VRIARQRVSIGLTLVRGLREARVASVLLSLRIGWLVLRKAVLDRIVAVTDPAVRAALVVLARFTHESRLLLSPLLFRLLPAIHSY
jgi:hypothetical protein